VSQALSDTALQHLRRVADWPDLSGTRYEIVEELGRGGMGTVYRAYDGALDRPGALKVMSVPDGGEDLVRRLQREAKILATLEHPGIVPVHDAGTLPDGRVFYTMKLVRGRRLDDVAAADPSLPERLRLFLRVAETIAFAHSRGVVHRDIKPENVMVGAFGEVLVLDWGIAKVHGEKRVAPMPARPAREATAPRGGTLAGTVLGTPGYMSPEQAAGEVDLVDERSDIYGLGALLGFVVSGRRPAEGAGGSEVDRGAAVPKRLAAVLRMATAVRPADRYPDVAALADDITRYLDGGPMVAYREQWWERVGRIAGKYRTPILLVLAYLAIRLLLLYLRR